MTCAHHLAKPWQKRDQTKARFGSVGQQSTWEACDVTHGRLGANCWIHTEWCSEVWDRQRDLLPHDPIAASIRTPDGNRICMWISPMFQCHVFPTSHDERCSYILLLDRLLPIQKRVSTRNLPEWNSATWLSPVLYHFKLQVNDISWRPIM